MINQIQEDTGADITIEDDGTIYIGAQQGSQAEAARATINPIANPTMPEVGERYLGTVVKTTTFGAFVSLMPGQGRPAAHLADPQARRRQARGERRGRPRRRRQGPGRDRRDRLPRQALADPRRRGRRGATRRRTTPTSDVPLHRDGPPLHRGAGRRPYPNPAQGTERHRHGPPHRPPRRSAGRHRDAAHRPLRDLRDLGGRRLPRRDPGAERRHPLPGAPALQGHRPAQRARHLLRDRRGRRRDERLHRQGVHLLLRAGARHRPAAGHRRRLRHAHRLADPAGGRRRRARRGPRRDRHDRGRPGRPGARPVHAHHARRHPARPPGPRHRRHHQRAHPRPDRPLLQASTTTRPTSSSPPRATSTTPRSYARSARRSSGPAPCAHRRRAAWPRATARAPCAPPAASSSSTARPSRPTSSSACPACPAPTSAAGRSACSTPHSAAA